MTLPTVKRPDSVRFQKDFQNCMSRFWVMRSNSAPRSSGSMTYFPDVRRERAAIPGGGWMVLNMSQKPTTGPSTITMACKPVKIKQTNPSQIAVYHTFPHMKSCLSQWSGARDAEMVRTVKRNSRYRKQRLLSG